MDEHQQAELESLLSLVVHGELTAEQHEQLRALLREHAGARLYFRCYIETTIMLEYEFGSMTSTTPIGDDEFMDPSMELTGLSTGLHHLFEYAEATRPTSDEFQLEYEKPGKPSDAEEDMPQALPHWWKKPVVKSSIAAALVLAGLLAALFLAGTPKPIATFSASHDAEFSIMANLVGDDLKAGPRELKRGVVQITFARGAKVLIEGPAKFNLLDKGSVRLEGGRLSAKVPPHAVGFTVRTPQVDVVDLGTEFGVYVADDGSTVVKVFDGQVETRDINSGKRTLIAADHARKYTLNTDEVAIEPFAEPAGTSRGAFLREMPDQTVASKATDLGANLLSIDFQNNQNRSLPTATQPHFKAFDNGHITGEGTASATYATVAGDVTLVIKGLQTSVVGGLFNRDPALANRGNMKFADLYNDFVFSNNDNRKTSTEPQSMTVILAGPGIAASTDYLITFYSYDNLASMGEHSVTYKGANGTAGSAGPLRYRGGVAPITNDQYAAAGNFTSDPSGNLTVLMTDVFTGSFEHTGIRLNGLEINQNKPSQK